MKHLHQDQDNQPDTIVERSFQTTVPDALELPDFQSYLEKNPGVLAVAPDVGHGSVRVRYDVRQLNFAAVQDLLAQAGAPGPQGIWQRWRAEWYVNLDSNMRDNARHQSACCSRPPPGSGRRTSGPGRS